MSKQIIPAEYTGDDPKFVRHSDEMHDIITAVPGRLIRWGMILFFAVFVMIISLAWFIHFPDLVKTSLRITQAPMAEMPVPQSDIQKVHAGQQVLIRLKSYPFEQYGIVKGTVKSISATLDNAGNFPATVSIDTHGINNVIQLKPGMLADAEVVTQDVSVFKRVTGNIFKSVKHK
jgi:hypothetical protein